MLGAGVTWNISNVTPVGDALARRYGVSLATVGLFTTALFVTHLLAQLPAGWLSDRMGARRVGIAAAALAAAGNGIALGAPQPALAVLGRLVVGLGSGAGFVAGADYMRAARATPLLQGIYGGSTMTGGGLAVATVPSLEHAVGWRASYASGLAIAAAVLLVLVVAPRDPPAASGPARRLVADRRLATLAAVHAASFGLSVVAANWVVELLTHHGHGRVASSVLGALLLLAGIVTRPAGGYLARYAPERQRPAIAIAIVVGAAGMLALALPLPLWVLGIGAGAAGLAAGLPFASVFAGAQRLRPDAPAAAVGFVNAVAVLTVVAGVPLAGLSFSLPGDGRIGFAAIAATWAAALVVVRRAPV